MPAYEVVAHDRQTPVYQSAENLADAKKMRDSLFASGNYDLVLIRRFFIDRYGRERCHVLHRLTRRRKKEP